MNSTIFHSLNATPDSRNISEMLTQLAPKLQNIVAQFRHDATTPETTLAFETALETCCREACRGLIEAEYNAIEPATLQDCPLRMRLAGENYKRRPKSPNVIGTLFGPIRLERIGTKPWNRVSVASALWKCIWESRPDLRPRRWPNGSVFTPWITRNNKYSTG